MSYHVWTYQEVHGRVGNALSSLAGITVGFISTAKGDKVSTSRADAP